jgi:hypothetical protein
METVQLGNEQQEEGVVPPPECVTTMQLNFLKEVLSVKSKKAITGSPVL